MLRIINEEPWNTRQPGFLNPGGADVFSGSAGGFWSFLREMFRVNDALNRAILNKKVLYIPKIKGSLHEDVGEPFSVS